MAAQAAQVRTTRQRMSELSVRKGSAGARPSGITRPGLSVISRTDQRIDSASRTSGSAAQAKRSLRGRMVLWMAVVLVVVLSFLGVLVVRVKMAEDAFAISETQQNISVLTQDVEQEQAKLDKLQASLPQKAQKLGMTPSSDSLTVDMAGTGQ